MDLIASTWNNSPISSSVSVDLINFGVPIPMGSPLSGTSQIQLTAGTTAVNTVLPGAVKSLRDQHNADLVIIFTSNISDFCGFVGLNSFWFGPGSTFVPASDGMDRRSDDTAAVAVVDITCGENIAAHEFGHLLGGGHYNPPGASSWLNDDSKGYAITVNTTVFGAPLIINVRTSVTNPSDCDATNPAPCTLTGNYSNIGNTFSNVKAFNQTAQSVANYRSVIPIPLILVPPINVSGFLYSHCQPAPWSHHQVFWEEGGSTAAVTYFLVESALSPGGPAYGWWTTTFETTPNYVTGASFFTSARACNTTACSGRSLSYFANWSPCG